MDKRLKAQHARFAAGIAGGKTGTQAAIDAGYSPKSARIQAAKLLTNPNIKAAIADLTDAVTQSQLITKERVLREYARIAFGSIEDFITIDPKTGTFYVDLSRATREQLASISEVTVDELFERSDELGKDGKPKFDHVRRTKLKLYPKQPSLDALAKYLALFPKDSGLPEIPEGYEITIGRTKKDQD